MEHTGRAGRAYDDAFRERHCGNHTGQKILHIVTGIVRPAHLAGLRGPGVHCSVPGELDHATGPAEATIDNPKGHTGPRPDPVKAGCQYCGTLEGAAEEWQHFSAAGLDR
jgi:hypothetical protein